MKNFSFFSLIFSSPEFELLGEILRHLDKPMNLRADNLRITLNLICLTSPYQSVKKKPPKSFTESSARLYIGDESIGDDLSDCL